MKRRKRPKLLRFMTNAELRQLVRELRAEVNKRIPAAEHAAKILEADRYAAGRIEAMQLNIRTAEMTLRGCMAENFILIKKLRKAGVPCA